MIAVANAVQHSEETLQSLQFGSRAMRVQTQAVVNECLDFKVITLSMNNITLSAKSQISDGNLKTCQHSRACTATSTACTDGPAGLDRRVWACAKLQCTSGTHVWARKTLHEELVWFRHSAYGYIRSHGSCEIA